MENKDKNKMHRVVKIATGEVDFVSPMIASDPNLLLEYGFILQELPENDSTKEEVAVGEEPLISEAAGNSDWEKPLEYQPLTVDSPGSETIKADKKPKESKNKNK